MSWPRRLIPWPAAAIGWLAMMPAAWGVSVNPTVVELRGAVGEQGEGAFEVTNDGTQATTISVDAEPLAAAYTAHTPSEWLTVNPASFTLQPGERGQVVYRVTVPRGAEGELAAEIVFAQEADGLQVRFGAALYLAVEGTEQLRLELEPLSLRGGTPPVVIVPVSNRGNLHCRPEGEVAIHRAQGDHGVAAHGRLPPGMPALPGRTERFFVSMTPDTLPPGPYQLRAQLQCHNAAGLPAALVGEQVGVLHEDGRWTSAP